MIMNSQEGKMHEIILQTPNFKQTISFLQTQEMLYDNDL